MSPLTPSMTVAIANVADDQSHADQALKKVIANPGGASAPDLLEEAVEESKLDVSATITSATMAARLKLARRIAGGV